MLLTEFLDSHRIPYRTEGEHSRPGWVQLDCPWCGRDSGKYHLGYSLAQHFVHCWKCGWHRIWDTILELVPDVSRDELRALYRPSDGAVVEPRARGRYREPKGVEPLGGAHKRYLRGRHFDPQEIECLWGVQGIGLRGQPPWRLFIPIVVENEYVAWTSRALQDGDNGPRYRSSSLEHSDIPVKELLYGVDYCRNEVIVVEGPTDTWRIGPGAVATLGTAVTLTQCELLSRFSVVHICFDNSPDAQRSAHKLYRELQGLIEVDIVRIQAKDPGSLKPREVRRLRQQYLS